MNFSDKTIATGRTGGFLYTTKGRQSSPFVAFYIENPFGKSMLAHPPAEFAVIGCYRQPDLKKIKNRLA